MRKDIWMPYVVWFIAVLMISGIFIFGHPTKIRINPYPHSVTAPQNISVMVDVPDSCHHAVICGGVQTAPGPNYKRSILPYNIWGYVTYRKDGKIYSTKVERMIPKGTAVWEDELGHIVLEKCGNMVMQYPDVDPATAAEPADIFPGVPPEIGDAPPPDLPPTVPMVPTSPIPPSTPPTGGPPSSPPCCGGGVPPVHVPEPSSFLFCGIGIFVVGLLRARKSNQSTVV
jgi:hypothetical protein